MDRHARLVLSAPRNSCSRTSLLITVSLSVLALCRYADLLCICKLILWGSSTEAQHSQQPMPDGIVACPLQPRPQITASGRPHFCSTTLLAQPRRWQALPWLAFLPSPSLWCAHTVCVSAMSALTSSRTWCHSRRCPGSCTVWAAFAAETGSAAAKHVMPQAHPRCACIGLLAALTSLQVTHLRWPCAVH